MDVWSIWTGGGRTSKVAVLVGLAAVVSMGGALGGCASDTPDTLVDFQEVQPGSDTPLHRVVEGPGEAATGRALYARYCQTCHGHEGRGDGPAADSMAPTPRDFTAGKFKFASTSPGLPPTDGDLYRTIALGVPGTPMPSWRGHLQSDEIWALVAYIKTFSDVFETPIPQQQIVQFPERPPADDASVERGAELYEQLGCPSCHGQDGTGEGPGASELTDHSDRPIQPRNLVDEPFKSGGRPRDVYRTISNGLEGTPMAPFGPALQSDEDRWHLVHYVMSLRDRRTPFDYLFGDEVAREILRDYRPAGTP